MVEKGILRGEEKFLDEPSRVWIKEMMEKSGVDFNDIEGKAVLSDQALTVYRKLGEQRTVNLILKVVSATDPDNKELAEFVEKYVSRLPDINFTFDPGNKKYRGDGTEGGDWRMFAVMKVEAVFSSLNKLLWIMAADNEGESERRQNTPGVLKHLRERVMRGHEDKGEIINSNNARFDNNETLRHLPKGSLGLILENLVK